jgi:hypothetical protein
MYRARWSEYTICPYGQYPALFGWMPGVTNMASIGILLLFFRLVSGGCWSGNADSMASCIPSLAAIRATDPVRTSSLASMPRMIWSPASSHSCICSSNCVSNILRGHSKLSSPRQWRSCWLYADPSSCVVLHGRYAVMHVVKKPCLP